MQNNVFALEGMPDNRVRNKNVDVHWFNPLTGEFSSAENRKLGDWTGFRISQSNISPFSLAIIEIVD
jgi:hypothetical protein